MKKLVNFVKKYWALILAGISFILGFILKGMRTKPHTPPQFEDKPVPPVEKKPTNFVKEHKDEKQKSDEKINNKSRSDLISSINRDYGSE